MEIDRCPTIHTVRMPDEEDSRHGPPCWATGSQLVFLQKRKPLWNGLDSHERYRFYFDMTTLFLKKYGWELTDNDDDDPDESQVEQYLADLAQDSNGDKEKAQEHVATRKRLHGVSIL